MDGILGAEHLTRIFGRWPSFHDAEVVRLTLDRADPERGDFGGPTLTLAVRVFTFGPDIAPSGHYVLHHETLATLQFRGVAQLALDDFNQQNALLGLRIDDIRGRQLEGLAWEVELTPAFGVGAQFQCAEVAVLAADDWPSVSADPASGSASADA